MYAPILINVCKLFAIEYDITLNGNKSQSFLKVDYIMFILLAFILMDNMLMFVSIQCTLLIPCPHVIEKKL